MKTVTIPAHTKEICRDIVIRCIIFVLPKDIDISGTPNSMCNTRSFKARFITNYIDNDFECCNDVF